MDIETELGETWGWIGDIPLLQQHVRIIWEQIAVGHLDSFIRRMPDRLRAVIAARATRLHTTVTDQK